MSLPDLNDVLHELLKEAKLATETYTKAGYAASARHGLKLAELVYTMNEHIMALGVLPRDWQEALARVEKRDGTHNQGVAGQDGNSDQQDGPVPPGPGPLRDGYPDFSDN